MAKRKKAVAKTANPVALSSTNVATESTNSSPAPASKKAAKTPKEKVVPKTPLETKTVCFVDQQSGKQFCGEMTEVEPTKSSAKVAGTKKRPYVRRRR